MIRVVHICLYEHGSVILKISHICCGFKFEVLRIRNLILLSQTPGVALTQCAGVLVYLRLAATPEAAFAPHGRSRHSQ